ncbi:MAG TPA: hypothetical protein VJ654_05795 [Noviherbaspirillum sp.]|nr:hypothetical protein [Noviherbaspirillum sp.]
MSTPSDCEPSLESKVAFLRQPCSFTEPSIRIEAIETHMSWVFLTESHAYKLKKPVHSEVLDFSTIEARHRYCEEEVHLNRRLAPDVYLDTVPLVIDAFGHLHVGGGGRAIDWLVRMRRLRAQNMLDYRLRNGTASDEDMRRIASRLADFYRNCPPVAIETGHYLNSFLQDIENRLQCLTRPDYGLPAQEWRHVCDAQCAFLRDRRDLFDARVQAGKIIEGHGDLRPEHVCLEKEVSIIDCLEFSRSLRITDAADELGFLALECERLGSAHLASRLLHFYGEASGDWPDPALLRFYQSYRAILRASIAIRHLDEEKFRSSPEWRRRAQTYLRLAQLRTASTK